MTGLINLLRPSPVAEQTILTPDRIMGMNGEPSALHKQILRNLLDEAAPKDDSNSIEARSVFRTTSPYLTASSSQTVLSTTRNLTWSNLAD